MRKKLRISDWDLWVFTKTTQVSDIIEYFGSAKFVNIQAKVAAQMFKEGTGDETV